VKVEVVVEVEVEVESDDGERAIYGRCRTRYLKGQRGRARLVSSPWKAKKGLGGGWELVDLTDQKEKRRVIIIPST